MCSAVTLKCFCYFILLVFVLVLSLSVSDFKPRSLLPFLSLPRLRDVRCVCMQCVCAGCQYWKADRRAPQMGFSCVQWWWQMQAEENVSLLSGQTLKTEAPASLTSPSLRLLTFLFILHAPFLSLSCSFLKKFPFSSPLLTQCLPQVLPISFFYAPFSSFGLTSFNPLLYLFQSRVSLPSVKQHCLLYYFYRQQSLMLVWPLWRSVPTSQINSDGWPNVPRKYSVKCSYIEIRLNTAQLCMIASNIYKYF